jgi:hypothetical protein
MACDAQSTHHLHDAVGGLGLAGGCVGLHRSGGRLGVGHIVLSEPAPMLTVRPVYLVNSYFPSPQDTHESHAEAAAALDTDAI